MRTLRTPPQSTGKKRIQAVAWAGSGDDWRKARNYGQLESNRVVTALFYTAAGRFRVRCFGATLEVSLLGADGRLRSSLVTRLPHGRRRPRGVGKP
jgi:hypothetical protein